MTRLEQRRFRRELATTIGLAACAMALLALLAPTLEIAWRDVPYASNLTIFLMLASITLVVPTFFPTWND